MIQTEKSKKVAAAARKKRGIIKAKRDFFQEARYGLQLTEQRIIYFAILTGQQNGKLFEPVTISVKDFKEVCGLSGDYSYTALQKITKKLIGKSVEVVYKDDDGKHLTQATWVSSITYHARSGAVTIVPNKELQKFFDNPKRNFSTTEFYFLVRFKCQYSERLYELFKSLDFKPIVDFTIDELREKLAVDKAETNQSKKANDTPPKKKYANFKDFRARVLQPAIDDINKYTDLDVDFRERRGKYNKIMSVNFSIHKKSVPLLYDREQSGEFAKSTVPDKPVEPVDIDEQQIAFWDNFDFLKNDVGVIIERGDKT